MPATITGSIRPNPSSPATSSGGRPLAPHSSSIVRLAPVTTLVVLGVARAPTGTAARRCGGLACPGLSGGGRRAGLRRGVGSAATCGPVAGPRPARRCTLSTALRGGRPRRRSSRRRVTRAALGSGGGCDPRRLRLGRHLGGLAFVPLADHLQPGPGRRRLGNAGGTPRGIGQDASHGLLVRPARLLVGNGGRRCSHTGRLAVRPLGLGVVELPVRQAVPDHLERQKMLPLLAQHPAQAFHVVVEELAVARGRTLRVDQPLALQEPDLRDRDVGEFLPQQGQDISDGEVRAAAHSLPATR